MSLPLREACQPILDDFKLNTMHATTLAQAHRYFRRGEANYMMIVGPCGQPLFNMTGIVFSRAIPTQKEIKYAATLLEEFLLTNADKVTTYVKKIRDFKRLEEKYDAERPAIDENFSNISGTSIDYRFETTHKKKHATCWINIPLNATDEISISVRSYFPLSLLPQVKISKAEINTARKFMRLHNSFKHAQADVEAAKSALSACAV